MKLDRNEVLETAALYVQQRRFDRAIDEYRKLCEADPRDGRTLLKMGDLQCRYGTHADAVRTYERAADVYVAEGHARKAIATYSRMAEVLVTHLPHLSEQHARVTITIAELYRFLGLTAEAVAVLFDIAAHLERTGKARESILILRKATELDPDNAELRIRLAQALFSSDETEGAAMELGVAASQLVSAGRIDDAIVVIERLLLHKIDPAYARLAAELYVTKGTRQDAIRALTKLRICMRSDESDVLALHLVAKAFSLIGDHARAAEVTRELAAIDRARGVPTPKPPSSVTRDLPS